MPFRWTLLAAHLALAAGAAARGETVYLVDSPHDVVDDNLLDGICHTVAGTCTLRAAIQEANRTPAGTNAAILLPEGQFAISIPPDILNGEGSGDFDFTTPASGERTIHIYGGGTERSIVDAGFVDRVFDVGDAVHLRLHDLALGNGAAFGAAGDSGGGGIKARGDVELHRVEVRGCTAAYGGAVWVPAGGTAHLRAYDTTFRDNTAGEGGAVYLEEFAILERTTLHGNWAEAGGAIFVDANGALRLVNSTVSANHANDVGAGILVEGSGEANVFDSTIAFNRADADQDDFGDAGGVAVLSGTFNVRNSLIVGNYVFDPQSNPDDCIGVVSSYGRNLFSDVAGCTVVTGDGSWGLLNDLGLLSPLAPHGGRTWTHALAVGSNAIDGGDPVSGCIVPGGTLAIDQRGAPRSSGLRCDLGAYEHGAWIFFDGFEAGGLSGWAP